MVLSDSIILRGPGEFARGEVTVTNSSSERSTYSVRVVATSTADGAVLAKGLALVADLAAGDTPPGPVLFFQDFDPDQARAAVEAVTRTRSVS